MGYTGKIDDREKAQVLRRLGYSYGEILSKIHVSKDTISRWCKDIALTESQKYQLQMNKSAGQRKGSIIAAERKRLLRKETIQKMRIQAKGELGDLNRRDLFIAGIALYAAEGDKTDGKSAFANSDPRLVRFMMQWFRLFCKVPEEKFRGAIWLHEGLDETIAKLYWSTQTHIPTNQFHKTYIVKRKPYQTYKRKNVHNYGVFTIRFSNSMLHRKIMGWIFALFDDKMRQVQ